MFLQKLKIAGPLAILVVGLLVAGGLAAANRLADPPPTKSAPLVLVPGNAEPARNLAPAQSKVLVWRRGELVMIGPDGTNEKVVLTRGGGISAASFALSPDGTRVAVIQPTNLEEPGEAPREVIMHLFVYELGRGGAGTDLGPAGRACWSPDGKQLAVNQLKEAEKLEDFRATHELVTVATRERSPLKLPADHFVVDWSRDGRFFLTAKPGGDFQKPSMELFLMNRDGTQHKQLISARTFLSSARLSADSQRVLWMTMKPKEEFAAEKRAREEAGGFPPRPTFELTVLDIATQKSTTVASVPENAEIRECCWSPDGKRIAYTWREALPTDPKEAIGKEKICHLTTCDPDGQNPKTILTARSDGTFSHPLDGLDWQFVAAEDKKTDAEKLAGTWKLVSVTDGGKKKTPDDGIFVIAKDTITFQRPGQPRTLSYKLDPTKKPRWITLEGNNVTTLGIYELDGDNLKLCFNDDPKGERPGKFASEPNSPNDLLMVLKREK